MLNFWSSAVSPTLANTQIMALILTAMSGSILKTLPKLKTTCNNVKIFCSCGYDCGCLSTPDFETLLNHSNKKHQSKIAIF